MAIGSYRRADGSTVVLARYLDPEGVKRHEVVDTLAASASATDLRRAKERACVRASELRVSVERGEWQPSDATKADKVLSFHALLDRFLRDYKPRSGAILYYQAPVAAFKRLMRDKPAERVTVADVEGFREARAKEVGASTVRKNLVVLGTVFRWAVARDLVRANPADPAKVRRPAEPKHRSGYLSDEQEAALLAACEPWLARVVRWAIGTGMDRQEVVDLDWSNIDEAAGVVWCPRSKTGVPRAIPLNDPLRAILRECKAVRRLDAPRVFLGHGKKTLTADKVKSALFRAYRAANLGDVRQPFKVFRHTFASRLAMRGQPLTVIARLLGHSTATISDRYAHLSPDYLRGAMASLEVTMSTTKALETSEPANGASSEVSGF